MERQTFPKDQFEVIIVDDGSITPLEDYLTKMNYHCKIRLIRIPNGGRSHARNTGAKLAKGTILLFVDDDIILSPDALQNHYQMHEKYPHRFVHGLIYDLKELMLLEDPEVNRMYGFTSGNEKANIVQSRLLSFARVFDDWENFSKKNRITRLEKLIQKVLSDHKLESMSWIGCVGGNVSLAKEEFFQVGGFDEEFVVWGGEDFELGYRLVKAGVTGLNANECFVYHMTHAHLDTSEQRDACEALFYQKHKDNAIHELYDYINNKYQLEQVLKRFEEYVE